MTLKAKTRYKTGSATEFQPLYDHLNEIGMYVELFAKKIDLPPIPLVQIYRDENSHLGKKNRQRRSRGRILLKRSKLSKAQAKIAAA